MKHIYFNSRDTFIRIDLSQYVSGIHCKVMRKADGVYIENLDSRNGTYVNGVLMVGEI